MDLVAGKSNTLAVFNNAITDTPCKQSKIIDSTVSLLDFMICSNIVCYWQFNAWKPNVCVFVCCDWVSEDPSKF